VRNVVLLCNDLAMVLFRPCITQVLGTDPLTRDGMGRWSAEVFDIYSRGLFVQPAAPPAKDTAAKARPRPPGAG
jgi:hypothetical protein